MTTYTHFSCKKNKANNQMTLNLKMIQNHALLIDYSSIIHRFLGTDSLGNIGIREKSHRQKTKL